MGEGVVLGGKSFACVHALIPHTGGRWWQQKCHGHHTIMGGQEGMKNQGADGAKILLQGSKEPCIRHHPSTIVSTRMEREGAS